MADVHEGLVAAIKNQLTVRGLDLSGPCGALLITNRVAWALRAEGAGLLAKPGGNQCRSYATDIVMYRDDGRLVDVLGDGGGANNPMWNETGEKRPVDQWRPPEDPGDTEKPPIPDPPPGLPPDSQQILDALAGITGQLVAIEQRLQMLAVQGDRNTEKIQTQIHTVVKNAETSLAKLLPLLKGGGGPLGGLTNLFGKK